MLEQKTPTKFGTYRVPEMFQTLKSTGLKALKGQKVARDKLVRIDELVRPILKQFNLSYDILAEGPFSSKWFVSTSLK